MRDYGTRDAVPIPSHIRSSSIIYESSNTGAQGSLPRTDTCIAFVQRTLPIALARPFIENYIPQGTKVDRI